MNTLARCLKAVFPPHLFRRGGKIFKGAVGGLQKVGEVRAELSVSKNRRVPVSSTCLWSYP